MADGGSGPGVDGSPVEDDVNPPVDFCDVVDCDSAIYVNIEGGSDGNVGTRASPLGSIAAAIDLASQKTPQAPVLVATGVYEESIALASGVSLYGGFDPGRSWKRDVEVTSTQLNSGLIAITADGIDRTTEVDGFIIQTASATEVDLGQSAIGILVNSSTSLVFRDLRVTVGNGGPGAPGEAGVMGDGGTDATDGFPGCESDGLTGCDSCPKPSTGQPGNSTCSTRGGRGGSPGHPTSNGGASESGRVGSRNTPGGAAATGIGGNGGPGMDGPAGNDGANGGGGLPIGTFSLLGYATADGGNGINGTNGGGGSGGGGGGGGDAGLCDSYGSSGGGGGGGGCGGTAGTGGQGGGGSFGIVLINSQVVVEDAVFSTSTGGAGGAGGAAGLGGNPGSGGVGGRFGEEFDQDDAGLGGPGGDGGRGGHGGAGGGGGGGPSITLVCTGTSTMLTPLGDTFKKLQPGTAGKGGAGINPGADGQASRQFNCGITDF